MLKQGNLLVLSKIAALGHMELNGNCEAVVGGCGGVLAHDGTTVRVRTPGQIILFTGRGLAIRCLTEDGLVVNGCITGIEFLGRGAP